MAKPKKKENVSVLDYLYKELSLLVKKVETSSGGKVSKRDLLIYACIGIFVLSVYFGKVLGGFTFMLVLVTLWNTIITRGLLKRSTEAFEQTRISFLVDIIDRTIEHLEKLTKPERETQQTSYIRNKAKAIKRINIQSAVEFLEAMVAWNKGKDQELKERLEEYEKRAKERNSVWVKWLGWEKGV